MFKRHFGVEFVENGVKKYGKWPEDFKRFRAMISVFVGCN